MPLTVFSSDKVIEYIPAYGGNREDDKPCIVGLKYVPFAKVQKYAKFYSKRSAGVVDQEELALITQLVQKKQFFDNVVSVSGVFDGPREITDVAEFYDVAPQPLIFEIMKVMENPKGIQAGRLKKTAPKKSISKGKKKKEG